jgi:hypothetical protein
MDVFSAALELDVPKSIAAARRRLPPSIDESENENFGHGKDRWITAQFSLMANQSIVVRRRASFGCWADWFEEN